MGEKWIPASELIRFVCGKKCGCERSDCNEPCEEVGRIEEFISEPDIKPLKGVWRWQDAYDMYYSSKWKCKVISPTNMQGKSVKECLFVNCICILESGEKICIAFPVENPYDVMVSADKDSMNIGFVSDTAIFSWKLD